jgi:1,4-dihydroxy-2-naphthoate polyprenyltransferase
MDDDKGSIGGIRNPPKVDPAMFYVTIVMDVFACFLCYMLYDIKVLGLLLSYILVSRAYSYRGIRLKKYPLTGFLVVTFFQGPIVFLITVLANGKDMSQPLYLLLAISWLLIGAGYPLSQIYQHSQDRADKVTTISMLLGIRGTFIFSQVMFGLLGALLSYYFYFIRNDWKALIIIAITLMPVGYRFNKWMMASWANPSEANYENTMQVNTLGAYAINALFIIVLLKSYLL